MKKLSFISSLLGVAILSACSNNDETESLVTPDIPLVLHPLSIISMDANEGDNQTFEYDGRGRIIEWTDISNYANSNSTYSAHYSYPDANTIKVSAEEQLHGIYQRNFEESIHLEDGRATKSEGTFICTMDGSVLIRKTYRLEFTYLPSNHLSKVTHSEVVGIGDEINSNAWDNAWTWDNFLVWEDGNLKEYQNFNGNSTIYQTTRYEYYNDVSGCPIIVPMVINNAHHLPLFRQGVYGNPSHKLVKSVATFDDNGNPYISRDFTYEIDHSRVVGYTETYSGNTGNAQTISYKVNWLR